MMKNRLLGLIFLLISWGAKAQEFSYKADIAPVVEKGYYNIILSPSLMGELKDDWSDLRIFDDTGQEQPYLLRQEKPLSTKSLFRTYEIIEKAYKKDAISHLIFSNPEKKAINNISFLVKNTDVQKRARLSGSDDREQWYVIKNDYLLHAMKSTDETSELKMLNFPLSDYAYFKLEINDNWKLPINILKVGYYDTEKVKGLTTSFDCSITHRKDSAKTTYLRLELPQKKYMEQLRFEVSGFEYYSRKARVKVERKITNRKNQTKAYFETIATVNLNSNSTNIVNFSGRALQKVYIEIDNKDDRPLNIESVEGSFLNCYMIASMAPESRYSLKFGNESLKAPEYDLANFADQLTVLEGRVGHDQLIDIRPKAEISKKVGLLDNPNLIWFVIGTVGLILAVVSVRMVRELGNK